MNRSLRIAPRLVAAISLFVAASARGDDTFPGKIAPILRTHCVTCHSTKETQGELDLERFTSLDEVKRHPAVWEKVLEQLATDEMPPKDKPRLAPAEKQALVGWTERTLREIALASAGDPGPVVLRRLSNMEYTYTLRDLTGVAELDPAREFPVDGAAGEGFTNAGAALVMSPSLLTKYLDAAKQVAEHAVLTPDGVRFSKFTTQQDQTDELLHRIREFYARYSTTGGATSVNLQGIKFDTNAGGRLPVERYIAALLKDRDALRAGKRTLADVAHDETRDAGGLNEKYLTALWAALNDARPNPLLACVRAAFDRAPADEPAEVVHAIEQWQRSLWRFASVGHIGKLNGPKAWQEPVAPRVSSQELRYKLKFAPMADGRDVVVYLTTSDAGDGTHGDVALWDNLRLVGPNRSDLPLKDVRSAISRLSQKRAAIVASSEKCLLAAAEADVSTGPVDVDKLAAKHGVDADLLAAWLDYLAIGKSGPAEIGPLLKTRMPRTPDYDFIKGWIGADALSVVANSSDNPVRIPGNMKPHGVAVHPAPKVAVVVAWRSPIAVTLQIDGTVLHAHPECGNGIEWALELRRGRTRERLAGGLSTRAKPVTVGPVEKVRVAPGDLVALVISPRDGSHACDLTAVDLTLSDGKQEWDLAKDVSPDILAGNPHADRHGNKDVWYFAGEPLTADTGPTIPADSVLAQWRKAGDLKERARLAKLFQGMMELIDTPAEPKESPTRTYPDVELSRQLLAFNGPLLGPALKSLKPDAAGDSTSPYGLDPALFGKLPAGVTGGGPISATSLYVQAPSVIEVRLPASLAVGAELVATGRLLTPAKPNVASGEGSVQMQILAEKPAFGGSGLVASSASSAVAQGRWSDNNLRTAYDAPMITADAGPARLRFEAAFDEFRALFPLALCYTKIVPVDEVVTLTLFYREDDQLKRLMLDDAQAKELDRLWAELEFVSEAPLKQVDVFEQLYQFATQDADPKAFEPLRKPIQAGAEKFKQLQAASEPNQVDAVLAFAALAWRRPLADAEQAELIALYKKLRTQELPHSAAVRMLLARVLVAPAFLYRGEQPAAGLKASAVSDHELATRLSYFLWAGPPDAELRALAAVGKLREPSVLTAQMRRMLRDPKVRRLALEFGCQYLHVRDVAELDEKSERHFPSFAAIRGDLLEESARFFTDLFQQDRAVTSLLDADHTFANAALAKHYGLKLPTASNSSDGWQRVDGLRAAGRGGILGFASTLARQSGASRTSPILRGNWVGEVVLGEKLPKPPKGVPILPEEAPVGLTERQLIERHSSDAKCASCHKRIDPLGFALEGFDAIGRARTKDAAGLAIDVKSKLQDGTELAGLDGLRSYLTGPRRDDFLRQFCRKLLGYALGRGVQLSDQPLVDSMLAELKQREFRIGAAVELIVLSPQFREVRGRDFVAQE